VAGAFPNISGAYPVRFPYTHTLQIRSAVQAFWSGKQQRYAISGLLNSFKFNWRRINLTDLQTVQVFFSAQKGAFDYTWSIPLVDPSTMALRSYANMAFNSDEFSYTENPNLWFSLGLDAVQTVGEAVAVTSTIYGGFGPHNLTSDTSNPPIVVSESSNFVSLSGFHLGYQAFDGSGTWPNVWLANADTGWLQIDLGTAQLLTAYGIQADTLAGLTLRAPNTWTMQGSPDGSTWTTLDTQAGQGGWSDGELRNFTCATPGTFRYFKLNITADNGDPNLEVAELYLYSTPPAIVVPSYPNINAGVLVQIPFSTAPSFKTFRNDLDSGKRISWAAWPSPLTKWALSYPAITDAEVQTLVNFYLGQGGAVNQFSFIDADTETLHSVCCFGAQGMELTRVSPNLNSLRCSIEEYVA